MNARQLVAALLLTALLAPSALAQPTEPSARGGASGASDAPAPTPPARAPEPARRTQAPTAPPESAGDEASLPEKAAGWIVIQPVRYRHEYHDDGDLRADRDDGDNRDLLKLGFGIDATPVDWLRARVMWRLTRNWGQNRKNRAARVNGFGQDTVDFYEGFVELGLAPLTGLPVKVAVGRQDLSFGDFRLFGRNEFGLNTRSWDAARVRIGGDARNVEVFYGRQVRYLGHDDRNPNRPIDTVDVFGAYGHLEFDPVTLEPFVFGQFDDNQDVTGERGRVEHHQLRLSPGLRVEWAAPLGFTLRSVNLLQVGESGPDKIFAWGSATRLDWEAPAGLGPLAGVRFEYVYGSGDTNPNDGETNTMDGLYPAFHKFHGEIDFVGWQNVHELHASVTLALPAVSLRGKAPPRAPGGPRPPVWERAQKVLVPAKLTPRVELGVYSFWLASKKDAWFNATFAPIRQDATGGSGREIGQEIDAALSVGPVRFVYSHFFPGKFARRTTGGRVSGADLFYAEVNLSF